MKKRSWKILPRYATLPVDLRREVDARTAGAAEQTQYFVDRLAQGVGMLAAAFWPRPVILRFSDFKTNEYARLVGGAPFEPHEENPMLGWRGASRYYHPNYKEGFLLEVAAVRRVREDFGLTNLKVMILAGKQQRSGVKHGTKYAYPGLSLIGRAEVEQYAYAR